MQAYVSFKEALLDNGCSRADWRAYETRFPVRVANDNTKLMYEPQKARAGGAR